MRGRRNKLLALTLFLSAAPLSACIGDSPPDSRPVLRSEMQADQEVTPSPNISKDATSLVGTTEAATRFSNSYSQALTANRSSWPGKNFVPLSRTREIEMAQGTVTTSDIGEDVVVAMLTDNDTSTLAAHVAVLSPSTDNYAEIIATYLPVVVPEEKFQNTLKDFINNSTATTQTNSFGDQEALLYKRENGTQGNPVFFLSLIPTENPPVGHHEAIRTVLDAYNGQSDISNPAEDSQRSTLFERDVTVTACKAGSGKAFINGEITNKGSSDQGYLIAVDIFENSEDNQGYRAIFIGPNAELSPGETWEFDEETEVKADGKWERCEAKLINPQMFTSAKS